MTALVRGEFPARCFVQAADLWPLGCVSILKCHSTRGSGILGFPAVGRHIWPFGPSGMTTLWKTCEQAGYVPVHNAVNAPCV
jgi:hypothetical protein